MATVQKKSKVRERHQRAISRFQIWLKKNPDATRARKVKTFDAYCDAEAMRDKKA